MSPRIIAAALLPCLAAAPAHANSPFQACTVMLFTAEPRSGEEQLTEALRQIAAHHCAPGDPLVVVGTHFQPRTLAAALCRGGAGVQISDMPDTQDHTRQLDCEVPARPRTRWGVGR
jgi:hypothetical protein